MKHHIFTAILTTCLLVLATPVVQAQSIDSTLVGRNVFEWVGQEGPYGNHIQLVQSAQVMDAVNARIAQQSENSAKLSGYRVRIFFDNKQTARNESAEIVKEFSLYSPNTAVYRIYENPYFKVTVGDFRTKSEAVKFMNEIKEKYPQAFIAREAINFPNL